MKYTNHNLSYFAESNYYSKRVLVAMKQEDRLMHTYIIGKTGTGKTTLLQTFIIQDILFGRGCCVFDIHGDLIKNIYPLIPRDRIRDVIYLNIADPTHNYFFNPLAKVPYERRPFVASGLLEVFEKLWKSAWGLKLEHILRYVILTLLDQEKANISDILRLLDDDIYREECLERVVGQDIKRFWNLEFKHYGKNDLLPIYNKVGAFLIYPAIRRLLIDNKKELSFRDILDHKKILLINISKGSLGENVASILGSLILNSISIAAFSRIDTPEAARVPFYVYLDEFQNYTTPTFNIQDLVNLSNYEVYIKLLIDGMPSSPFSAKTIKWT